VALHAEILDRARGKGSGDNLKKGGGRKILLPSWTGVIVVFDMLFK